MGMITALPTVIEIVTEAGKDRILPSLLLAGGSRLQSTVQYVYDLESLSTHEISKGSIVLKGELGAIAIGQFELLQPGDYMDGKEILILASLKTFSPGEPIIPFILGMDQQGLIYIGTGTHATSLIQQRAYLRSMGLTSEQTTQQEKEGAAV
jgi:hypothetical protein